jgi:3-isopropylmalate/(R)-2-methylmalate dehydratase small subunit
MDKFEVFTGTAVPLRRSNVDTDQIIPAVYLKRITKTGYDDALFAAWRGEPDFILNQEPYKAGQVLIAGPDFGTGSSREHAVWALRDYGFKAVFSSKFADIFRGNSGKQGLLSGVITDADTEKLWQAIEAQPGIGATVDLVAKTVSVGSLTVNFEIDDYTRWRLLEGLDDIGLTLQNEQAIADFEAKRPSFKPQTLPAKGV